MKYVLSLIIFALSCQINAVAATPASPRDNDKLKDEDPDGKFVQLQTEAYKFMVPGGPANEDQALAVAQKLNEYIKSNPNKDLSLMGRMTLSNLYSHLYLKYKKPSYNDSGIEVARGGIKQINQLIESGAQSDYLLSRRGMLLFMIIGNGANVDQKTINDTKSYYLKTFSDDKQTTSILAHNYVSLIQICEYQKQYDEGISYVNRCLELLEKFELNLAKNNQKAKMEVWLDSSRRNVLYAAIRMMQAKGDVAARDTYYKKYVDLKQPQGVVDAYRKEIEQMMRKKK